MNTFLYIAEFARLGTYIFMFIMLGLLLFAMLAGKLLPKKRPEHLTVTFEEHSPGSPEHGQVTTNIIKHAGKIIIKVPGQGEIGWLDYDAFTNSLWLRLKVDRPEPEITV